MSEEPTKKCYSTDRENFRYKSIDEAALDLWGDPEVWAGDVCSIYEADKHRYKASVFIPDTVEEMLERAGGEAGEHADGWWDDLSPYKDELQKIVESAVDKWATDKGMHPKFWGAKNVKPISIRFTDRSGSFEIVEEEPCSK